MQQPGSCHEQKSKIKGFNNQWDLKKKKPINLNLTWGRAQTSVCSACVR